MELRHLRYFVAVAEELHFSRAAARLNMSQPPLSRQIQELEEEVGVPLLVREPRKVELTPAGEVYLAQAKRILEQVEAAKHHAAAAPSDARGQVSVRQMRAVPKPHVARVLAAFHKEAPRVAVDLFESATPRILKALRRKTIDVGFVIAPSRTTGLVVSHYSPIGLSSRCRRVTNTVPHLSRISRSWHTRTSCSARGTPTPVIASWWKGSAAMPDSRHACCKQ
jgi:DNA-binding transcriptional LysR family regulator